MRRVLAFLAPVLVVLSSAGCGADFWAFQSVQNTSNPSTSFLIVWLSDSPADGAEALEVTIERVELVGVDGAEVLDDTSQTFDLLTLQNGMRASIAEADIPIGAYQAVRLTLRESGPLAPRIRTAGAWQPLVFASSALRVVHVPFSLNAQEGGRSEIQIDFNARLSVIEVGGELQLEPRLDAVDPLTAGDIVGRVVDAGGLPVAGAVVIVRVGGMEFRSTTSMIDGSYRLTPLPAGTYDVEVVSPAGPLVGAPGILVVPGAEADVILTLP